MNKHLMILGPTVAHCVSLPAPAGPLRLRTGKARSVAPAWVKNILLQFPES